MKKILELLRTNKRVQIFLALLIIATLGLGYWLTRPVSYEDCILQNMRGVKSDDAAREIKFACEVKSWSQASDNSEDCKHRKLTDAERKLISGNAVVETYGWLKVTIYNGNSSIGVNGIKVKLIDTDADKEFMFDLSAYKVSPLTTSDQMLARLLYAPKNWKWEIYEIGADVCK
jgi:hypothetical protein